MLIPTIPPQEFFFSTARSSGPGGQNVNKVETKAQLRWCVGESKAFSDGQKNKIRRALGKRVTIGDEVMINVDEERSQVRNKVIAIERLHGLIGEALKPKKIRRRTRPGRASIERRLDDKKRQSRLKKTRKMVSEF
ncbi:MAG: aminoacyl-tRNA hydrolase [Candidatus Magasanikbacteria bacterium]|nr:aminoacyl-tRNA hydrolase [Candidatus Magasanikbacteria bacterium]